MASFALTRRHLRLGSGAVLWVYIAWHLLNHSLGLVSLGAAEGALRVAVAAWQSWPGTVLLYGAFATHITLAFNGLYHRHSFQLPPQELLRIAFGLTIPLLLIAHAVSTRAAWEMYGLPAQYQRVVWNLINSGTEGRQMALLAPGWLHGCMGLLVAMRHTGFYRRWRWGLFAFIAVLPLTAAAGFLVMSHEIGVLAQDANWKASHIAVPTADQTQALALLRQQLLYAYFAMLGVVVAARTVRRYAAGPRSRA